MKHNMSFSRTFIAITLIFFMGFQAYAESFKVNGINYTITNKINKTVEVARGDDGEYFGPMVIPATVNYSGETYSVTSIGDYAFGGCSQLTSITIPNSITTIGEKAFDDCWQLKSITIPNSVTTIGDSAFWDCFRLTSITIPNSVTYIGKDAFERTDWYDNKPNGVIYINKVLYKYKGWSMPENTYINIARGTVSISPEAFYQRSNLTSVTIPNSVTTIGDYAFCGCTNLTSITVPNSVTSIGFAAFNKTRWYANKPEGIVYIGKVLYEYKGDMPSNTSINVADGTASISRGAFYDCRGLTSITLPASMTSIGEDAFYDTNINKIISFNPIPPTFVTRVFSYASRQVYVPKEGYNAYSLDKSWGEFPNIKTIEIINSLTLKKTAVKLRQGSKSKLSTKILPKNATIKRLQWESDNPSVATVDQDGYVTAINVGTATITATTTDGSNISASCVITVRY